MIKKDKKEKLNKCGVDTRKNPYNNLYKISPWIAAFVILLKRVRGPLKSHAAGHCTLARSRKGKWGRARCRVADMWVPPCFGVRSVHVQDDVVTCPLMIISISNATHLKKESTFLDGTPCGVGPTRAAKADRQAIGGFCFVSWVQPIQPDLIGWWNSGTVIFAAD